MQVLAAFDSLGDVRIATARQLLAAGSSRSAISRAVREGRLVRLSSGVFSRPGAAVDGTELASRCGVLSHRSAAHVLGLDTLAPPDKPQVTVPHRRRSLPPSLDVRRARLPADDVVELRGLRVTSPARTVVDLARAVGHHEAVVAADSVLRLGMLSADDLAAIARSARGPGSGRVRAVVAAADARSESALESLLRLLLARAGLHPEPQAVIHDEAGFVARVDFLFPDERLVVEADGFEFHSGRAAYRNDRRRGNALLRAGYRIARFSWEDVHLAPHMVVATVRSLLSGD